MFVAIEIVQVLSNNARSEFLQRFESAQLAIDFPLMKGFCMLKDVYNFLDGFLAIWLNWAFRMTFQGRKNIQFQNGLTSTKMAILASWQINVFRIGHF